MDVHASRFEFGVRERANAETLINLALEEDLGVQGDLTSRATIPIDAVGSAVFVARAHGVLAGLPVLAMLCGRFGVLEGVRPHIEDGASLAPGTKIATVSGSVRNLLALERTALNFLQRLSGVATMARKFVDQVSNTKAKILDTRKTTPGWRFLEKYAVRCGGALNHRIGLFDAILIKDNHLACLANHPDPIGRAVNAARGLAQSAAFIELEVDRLEQFDLALKTPLDMILLDNFSLEDLREAVRRRNDAGSKILLEASGGVNLDTVRDIAETGVDWISVGALTHSAPALDIALDEETSAT